MTYYVICKYVKVILNTFKAEAQDNFNCIHLFQICRENMMLLSETCSTDSCHQMMNG